MDRTPHVLLRRAGILLVIALLVVAGLEASARLIWNRKYDRLLENCVHEYEHLDYDRDLIVPNPGARLTVQELRSDLEARGRAGGLRFLDRFLSEHALPASTAIISINAFGFRGPEIEVPKPDSTFRIMTIGDSCTWGLGVGNCHTYPSVMQRELNGLIGADCGLTVEVVNAGFCGDGFERALWRVGEDMKVEPDLATIYLGWNRTILRADPRKNRYLYRHFALYRFYYHLAVNRAGTRLQALYGRSKSYDPTDEALEPFRQYSFEYDLRDLDRIVETIRNCSEETEIVLITLPGLLDMDIEPAEATLADCHPLPVSGNMYLFPLLTGRFNDEIRQYARDKGLAVIDLERYARKYLIPKSEYFMDEVHPNVDGYAKIGRFLASELSEYLPRD